MFSRTLTTALLGAALVVTGCSGDDPNEGTLTPTPPLAYYRIVNAIPDTNAIDYRFTDTIEQSQPTVGLRFRQFTAYQGTLPGSRPMTAFLNPFAFPQDNSVVLASTVIESRTLDLQAGSYYTIIHAGNARGDGDSLIVIQDNFPTLAAGQIGLRAIHAAAGVAAVNVLVNVETSAALATPAAASFANLAFRSAANYAVVASRPAAPATSSYQFAVEAVAAPGTAVANSTIGGVLRDGLTGTVPTSLPPVAAVKNAGSVLSAVILPPSVAAPVGVPTADRPAFAAPGIVYMPDKNP
jgi:hypothetical protein